jgi:hypothetical protein
MDTCFIGLLGFDDGVGWEARTPNSLHPIWATLQSPPEMAYLWLLCPGVLDVFPVLAI